MEGALTSFSEEKLCVRGDTPLNPSPRLWYDHPMAIYHLTAKTGSRAGGQSASAKDDYIEREGRYDGDRSELEHSESGHMPEWAEEDSHAYWEAADVHERANGRLFREVEFALPVELDEGERRELALEFAQSLTREERLPYTLAIHRGLSDEPGKPNNPHCHLMISERANDGLGRTPETWFKRYNGKNPAGGGARKSTATRPREWLEDTRESWAEHANRALERAGSAERIDDRSHEDRFWDAVEAGDEREADRLQMKQPGVHVGPTSKAMERSGRQSRRAALQRQVEAFNARAELMKTWERLVRIGEQLREAGRRLQERLSKEVESLRKRQDYVQDLYKKSFSDYDRHFFWKSAADRSKANLEQRIQELPEAEREALNRRAQSMTGLKKPSQSPELGRGSGRSR